MNWYTGRNTSIEYIYKGERKRRELYKLVGNTDDSIWRRDPYDNRLDDDTKLKIAESCKHFPYFISEVYKREDKHVKILHDESFLHLVNALYHKYRVIVINSQIDDSIREGIFSWNSLITNTSVHDSIPCYIRHHDYKDTKPINIVYYYNYKNNLNLNTLDGTILLYGTFGMGEKENIIKYIKSHLDINDDEIYYVESHEHPRLDLWCNIVDVDPISAYLKGFNIKVENVDTNTLVKTSKIVNCQHRICSTFGKTIHLFREDDKLTFYTINDNLDFSFRTIGFTVSDMKRFVHSMWHQISIQGILDRRIHVYGDIDEPMELLMRELITNLDIVRHNIINESSYYETGIDTIINRKWIENDVLFDAVNYLSTGQIDDKFKHYIHIINTIGGIDNER